MGNRRYWRYNADDRSFRIAVMAKSGFGSFRIGAGALVARKYAFSIYEVTFILYA